MIKFYITEHGLIKEIEAPQTGCWISVVEPTEEVSEEKSSEAQDEQEKIDKKKRGKKTKKGGK